MQDALMVYMTVPDKKTARTLADTLTRERLAASVMILDAMESWYWWRGEVRQARECVCLATVTQAGYAALEKRARDLHPYELPCITAFPIARGHAPFLQWIADETENGARV